MCTRRWSGGVVLLQQQQQGAAVVGAAAVGAGGVHAAGAAQARLPAHQRAGEDLRDDPVQIVKEGRPLPQDAEDPVPLCTLHIRVRMPLAHRTLGPASVAATISWW